MRPELIAKPREASSAGRGSGDVGSFAFRGRLDQATAMGAPVVLLLGLVLAGGGYDVSDRHLAGLGAWLVVIVLLVFGVTARATVGRPLYWASGLIAGLAVLSALSSLWSGSTELSVIEGDRVLVYLGFFLAAFLIAQTDERRQRFAEGLAIAFALIALLGLASRLLPHVLEVSNSLGTGPRLRYPLGYWNANGAICGVGVAMLLWTSRRSDFRALRWLSVAAIPAVLLCLYFTYSRGGLLALLVAVGVLVALSRDRLWLLATGAIGLLATLPAILSAQAHRSLADNIDNAATIDQGVTVLFILVAGIAAALLLYAGLQRIESRDGALTGRVLGVSRNPRVLRWIAIAGASAAVVLAIAVGGRAWDQFSSSDIQFPDRPEQHFSQLSGAGRHDFWRVSVKAFGEKPLLGHGAGTYEFSWEQHRSIDMPVHDAHSLYLEAFADLGTVGGVLTLAMVGFLLWCAFAAWRGSPEASRDRYAVLLAAMVALAIGAAFDWFWEIAAVGAVFFLAAGVAVACRCAQLAAERRDDRLGDRRYLLTVTGLAVAWLAAVGLIGPLLVDREIKASQDAAAAGDIGGAVSRADTARSIEPWAATPYVQLGLLAELQEDYDTAAAHLTEAIEREDRNWQLYYLRARVEEENGNDAAARADLEKAKELNPRAPELAEVE